MPAEFYKWLTKPHVLKEWFDTANAHRPEARHPTGPRIDWNEPGILSLEDCAHVRWARAAFDAFSECVVKERPALIDYEGDGYNESVYIMDLYLRVYDEAFKELVRSEGREHHPKRVLRGFASQPVWSSCIHVRDLRACAPSPSRPSLPAIHSMNDYPITPMLNEAKYYWHRVRNMVRVRSIALFWQEETVKVLYKQGGAGQITAHAEWDEDPFFGSE